MNDFYPDCCCRRLTSKANSHTCIPQITSILRVIKCFLFIVSVRCPMMLTCLGGHQKYLLFLLVILSMLFLVRSNGKTVLQTDNRNLLQMYELVHTEVQTLELNYSFLQFLFRFRPLGLPRYHFMFHDSKIREVHYNRATF